MPLVRTLRNRHNFHRLNFPVHLSERCMQRKKNTTITDDTTITDEADNMNSYLGYTIRADTYVRVARYIPSLSVAFSVGEQRENGMPNGVQRTRYESTA
jgi:hypothetical protein